MKTLFLAIMLMASGAHAQGIVVIVSDQNPVASLTRSQLSDYFLKKSRNWPHGIPVRFFDRLDESPERKQFLRTYIQRSSRDLELYWIGQKLYSGHSAPSQISSDAVVEMMVARFPGAIGYVSSGYILTRPVKKISITEP